LPVIFKIGYCVKMIEGTCLNRLEREVADVLARILEGKCLVFGILSGRAIPLYYKAANKIPDTQHDIECNFRQKQPKGPVREILPEAL
jgi:hypothetical protein